MPNSNATSGVPTQEQKNQLIAWFNEGDFAQVEAQARFLLQECPDSGFAWSLLGGSLHMQGKDALPAIQKAAELSPNDAAAHNNLGNALSDRGNKLDAIASYRRALEIEPQLHAVHCNLGNVLKEAGQLDEAVVSYRRALEVQPDYADAYGYLGAALRMQGKLDDALACFERQVQLAPDNLVAQHHIASLSGKTTEGAPRQYVEGVFDGYAESFDNHLQNALQYEVPSKLVDFMGRHVSLPPMQWNVLDLGCGTGLSGLTLKPFSRQLVGVDLSSKMLEKARARGIYQRLEHSDLRSMMQAEDASSYDAVVSMDVFIYVGRIDEVVAQAKRLLRPNGIMAFSIEYDETIFNAIAQPGEKQDYVLQKSGRYLHSPAYISNLAAANQFKSVAMESVQIRLEAGKPIAGKIVVLIN